MDFHVKGAACWIGGIGLGLGLGCGIQDESGVSESRPEATRVQRSVAALTSCTQESDCPSGLACLDGACQPCFAHGQCQSDVCDAFLATDLGPGACIPQDDVVYVDAAASPVCETGDGTRSNPVCSITAAIPLTVGNLYAVRVYPGHYFPFHIAQRTVYVFGPGDGTAVVGEEDDTAAAGISEGARVVLDGLDFRVHVHTGVRISDSDVQVRNATVAGDDSGIVSTNSTLFVDRVRATGLTQYGLKVDGSGTYNISNSYFQGGDFPAVAFTGSSRGRFVFNSVLGGGELHPGGIDCGITPRLLQDSIVVHNTPGAGGAQTVGACSHRRVVVGSGDTRTIAGLIKIDPDLDAQGRLLDTAANAACCIDRGNLYTSSLYRDFYGTPRPQGQSNDIGADERPQVVAASADAHIRTDLDIRRNDNYGCQESMVIGTSRGGGGIPFGGPDAMRALVRFDLTSVPAILPSIQSAILEMTVDGFDHGLSSSLYQVDLHRIIPGPTPWDEGNGLEGGALSPPECTNVDDASGVAWDSGEPFGGNNQTQPAFDPAVAASATISQASNVRGDKIRWDITPLVRAWSSGAVPNDGILLLDPTSDGSFRGVRFGARDGLLRGFPDALTGPQLIIIRSTSF